MGLATELTHYGPFVIETWPSGNGDGYLYSVRWTGLMPEVEPGTDYILSGGARGRSAALIRAENELIAFVGRTITTLKNTQAELVDSD